jgi:uncharacterized membrane protein YeaQ/YmgE (transglycosylase-associated protein family)
MPSLSQLIVWIAVGLIGGTLAGLLIKWDRKGFGVVRNLGLGLVGAFVGGLLFRLFGLFPGLDKYAISLRDVVAAVVGVKGDPHTSWARRSVERRAHCPSTR